MNSGEAMDRAQTTDDLADTRPNNRRSLGLAVLAIVLIAVAAAVWIGQAAQPSGHATIDEANATTLARDFFDGAHGTGATVANVQIMSIALGNDSAGHSVWKVNISGDVLEAGRSSPSYTSYMWLYVDATSGVVTIFSQG